MICCLPFFWVFGRLADRYFVNGYFEFQCAREMHICQRTGRSPVFARGVQPFPSISLSLSGGLLGTFASQKKTWHSEQMLVCVCVCVCVFVCVCVKNASVGDRFLSSAGAGENCVRPMRLPDPSPVLDKNCAHMGPEILSSTKAGVWRRAPMAFSAPFLYWINFSLRFRSHLLHPSSGAPNQWGDDAFSWGFFQTTGMSAHAKKGGLGAGVRT